MPDEKKTIGAVKTRSPRTIHQPRVMLIFGQKYADTFQSLADAAKTEDRELGPYIVRLLAQSRPASAVHTVTHTTD